VILSPGKFERLPLYIAYFWYKGIDGFYDFRDECMGMHLTVLPEDRAQFPEIPALVDTIVVWQDDHGFVGYLEKSSVGSVD